MKEKLNGYHIVLLVYMIQSGVIIFSLPNILATSFGYNGWIFLLVSSLIVVLNLFLISKVHILGKGESIFHILEKSIPKLLLYPLYIGLGIVWAFLGCMVAKQYVLLFQLIALKTSPPMLFKLVLSILAFLLLIKGIYNIAKAATLIFYLSAWMVFLLVFHLPEFEWARFTPFLFKEGSDMLKGGFNVYTSFLGYELTILLIPYIDRKTRFFRSIFIGNMVTTTIYLSVVLTCFGFYGFHKLQKSAFPVMNLLSYIQFPFIERIENLLFTIFFLKVLITTTLYYWAALEVLQRVFPKFKPNFISFMIVCGTYIVAFIPNILREVSAWLLHLAYVEVGIAFLLPCLLIVLIKLQKRKRGSLHAQG